MGYLVDCCCGTSERGSGRAERVDRVLREMIVTKLRVEGPSKR